MKKGFLSLFLGSVLFYGVFLLADEGNGNLLPSSNIDVSGRWKTQYNKLASYKLIKDISFKSGYSVLEINNPVEAKRPVAVRCVNFSLPAKGVLKASIWGKGSGLITLFLIPSDWKGKSFRKTFPIGRHWKEYAFEIDIPEHLPEKKYFFRVDCSGKGKIYVAAPCLQMVSSIKGKKQETYRDRYIGSPGRNLVINPGFELGWTGWHPRYFDSRSLDAAIKQLKRPLPEVKENVGVDKSSALYMPAGNIVESLCIPLVRGKTYTVSFSVKGDAESEAKIFVLDYKWKSKNKKIRLKKNWTRYSFTFKWNQPCFFDEVYLRFDSPENCGMAIDNIQFEEGAGSDYEPPPVTIGVLARSNIYNKDEKTNIILKAIPAKGLNKDCKIFLDLKDYNGILLRNLSYDLRRGEIFQKELDLPTSKYGLYSIELKVLDSDGKVLGIGYGRYAVICKLPDDYQKNYSMGVNFAPHRTPRAYYSSELPVWHRLGVGNALSGYPTKYSNSLENQDFIKLFKEGVNYFKDNGCNTFMRVSMPHAVRRESYFNDFPAGNELWGKYVENIVNAYSDVSSVFAFMGEVNIYRMRERYRKEYKGVKFPPNGYNMMPPGKAFNYYKTAYIAAKKANPSIKVCGPSINGEDFPYVRSFMGNGAAKYMDVYGMDAYRAGPDTPEVYADYMELRHILSENGFNGPVINLEQYLGICVKGYLGASERTRKYYTPWNKELHYAGVIARNYLQHAAAGITWVNYAPEMSLYDPFVLQGGFPSMAAPATAAATLFLNKAGQGVRITNTNDIKAFVFPDAVQGPLMIVYLPTSKTKGTIKIDGIKEAYDIMGNVFSSQEIEKGLTLSSSPVYLRFPEKTELDKIKETFAKADIKGIGAPFRVQIIALGENKLALVLANRTNKVLSGEVSLLQVPDDWDASNKKLHFQNLKSGEKRRLIFDMKKMPIESQGKYPVSVSVVSGDYFTGKEQVLSPIFADYMPDIDGDTASDQWKMSNWSSIDSSRNLVYAQDDRKDKDLRAEFACGWNEKGFLLQVKVDDKDYFPPSESESIMYQADSIQVYFDQLKDALPQMPVYNDNDVVYQIGSLNGVSSAYLEEGPEGRYLGPGNTLQGIDKDLKVNIMHEDGILSYRIFFPWHTLRYVKPLPGEVFGFSLFVHDKDKESKCGISFEKKSPYRKPFVWKDLILKK
jgi:hypothetical protein